MAASRGVRNAVVLAAAALLLLSGIGSSQLRLPDEPRYAQIAEELRSMEHGPTGLLLTRVNGTPYTQKPPLYFWLAALFGTPNGHVSELAIRLPAALAGVAAVGVTLALGTRLLGPGAGALGALLLLTSFRFAHFTRRAMLDAPVVLAIVAALAAFWRLDRGIGRRRTNLILLHAAIGTGVLFKGPIALLVPAAIIASYLLLERRPRDLLRLFPPWALLLSLGPGLVWLATAAALAPPGFFHEAVVENVFERAVSGAFHDRPFHYYLLRWPIDFLPWTLLVPLAVHVGRTRVFAPGGDAETRRSWRFLGAWFGATFVLFSLFDAKRGNYLLPLYPAAALICAHALVTWLRQPRELPRGWAALALLALVPILAVLGLPLERLFSSDAAPIPASAAAAFLAIAAATGLAWLWLSRSRRRSLAFAALAVTSVFAVEWTLFTSVYPVIHRQDSLHDLALAADDRAGPDEPLGLVGFEQNSGVACYFAYYSGRPIVALDSEDRPEALVRRGGRVMLVPQPKPTPASPRFRIRTLDPPATTVALAGNLGKRRDTALGAGP